MRYYNIGYLSRSYILFFLHYKIIFIFPIFILSEQIGINDNIFLLNRIMFFNFIY